MGSTHILTRSDSHAWPIVCQSGHWWKLASLKSRYVFLPGRAAASCMLEESLGITLPKASTQALWYQPEQGIPKTLIQ